MKTKIMMVLLLAGILSMPVMADFYQEWDSTPSFPSQYDKLIVRTSAGDGIFGDPMSDFTTGSGWISTLPDLHTAIALSLTPLEGSADGFVNKWTLNFGTGLSTPFDIQIQYFLGDDQVNINTWHYDGTGTGSNPVSSWSQVPDGNFVAQTPEPASWTLFGAALAGVYVLRRRKQNAR